MNRVAVDLRVNDRVLHTLGDVNAVHAALPSQWTCVFDPLARMVIGLLMDQIRQLQQILLAGNVVQPEDDGKVVTATAVAPEGPVPKRLCQAVPEVDSENSDPKP